MLNATKIAKELNSEAKTVNKALLALGFMAKETNGYVALHEYGETKTTDNNTYVVWNDAILSNKLFTDKVDTLKDDNNTNVSKEATKVDKEAFLSATEIAKKLGLKATQINNVLVDIHYLDRLGKGYRSNHKFAKQLLSYDENKTPYVKWSKKLLDDSIFLREIERVKSNKDEFKKEVKKTPISKETGEPSPKKKVPFKFDRKTFDAKFRTQSGHFVRSRGEVIVADWLYNNDIMFAYEKRLPEVEELYSDFFIKKGKIYIEVWGLESTQYLDRKKTKIKMYEEKGYNLIGLEDSDIENIDDFLPLKLAQSGISI